AGRCFSPRFLSRKTAWAWGSRSRAKARCFRAATSWRCPANSAAPRFVLCFLTCPMASKKVLIVDDEDNIGRSLRMILEREGYAVSICGYVAELHKNGDTQR